MKMSGFKSGILYEIRKILRTVINNTINKLQTCLFI